MKKVNIYLMNKGGVGKTPLVIFTLEKLLKGEKKDFLIIDCDSNKHSLFERFESNKDIQKTIRTMSLSLGENANLDYSQLETFFTNLSNGKSKEYYIDFGQDDSNALIKFLNTSGANTIAEGIRDLGIELTLCPVIAVGDIDCVNGLEKLVIAAENEFKIVPYANLLNASGKEDANLLRLEKYCTDNRLKLLNFNHPNLADGQRLGIHNYLVSGFSRALGFGTKGVYAKIIDTLEIA